MTIISFFRERFSILFSDGVLSIFFGESDGFAGSFSQEVKFCTSCFSTFCCLNIDDVRGIEGEDSFNAFICDEPSDGEGFAHPGPFSSDDGAAEDLDALLIAFDDFIIDVYGIANLEMGQVLLQTFLFYSFYQFFFHGQFS